MSSKKENVYDDISMYPIDSFSDRFKQLISNRCEDRWIMCGVSIVYLNSTDFVYRVQWCKDST